MGVPLGRFTARSEWISNDAIEKGCSTRHEKRLAHRACPALDREPNKIGLFAGNVLARVHFERRGSHSGPLVVARL